MPRLSRLGRRPGRPGRPCPVRRGRPVNRGANTVRPWRHSVRSRPTTKYEPTGPGHVAKLSHPAASPTGTSPSEGQEQTRPDETRRRPVRGVRVCRPDRLPRRPARRSRRYARPVPTRYRGDRHTYPGRYARLIPAAFGEAPYCWLRYGTRVTSLTLHSVNECSEGQHSPPGFPPGTVPPRPLGAPPTGRQPDIVKSYRHNRPGPLRSQLQTARDTDDRIPQ